MPEAGDWKATLDVVKDECASGLWSRGVSLARTGAVAGDRHEGAEWAFRVRLPGDEVAPTVLLFPEDQEWDCDCEGPSDPCEHVAACAIAAVQADGGAESLFEGAASNGTLRYVLQREPSGLRLERFVVVGDEAPRRLSASLYDFLEAEGRGLSFEPSREDLEMDHLLPRPEAPITFERSKKLLSALVGVKELRLEDREVRASADPVFPRATVRDGRTGVDLVIEVDSAVSEIVGPGIVRAGDRLHPFGAGARFGPTWEKLPFRRSFRRDEFGDLVGRVLPELERHIRVDIQSSQLPKRAARSAPWIQFEIDHEDEGTDVLARLVYGSPPVARVEEGRLVHLGGEVPDRDEPAERALAHRLRDELNLVLDRRVRLFGPDAEKLLSALPSFDAGRRDRAGRVEAPPDLVPQMTTSAEGATPDVVFHVSGGARDVVVSAEAVVRAWEQGRQVVALPSGGFAQLPEGWLERHGHLVADLVAARSANDGATPRAALPILGALCEALDAPPPFGLEQLRGLLERTEPDALGVPDGFRGTLRPYQADGVQWLGRVRDAELGAILADDMGLGKTVQALCAVRGRTLIVCPRSVIHNWTREAERFRPDLSVALYHGPKRALTDADVTLTTYATLRNDIDDLASVSWGSVVLDEAQAIKNPDSQVAKAAYRLEAAFRISLSGTPIENRLDELWSQMHFVNRGLLGGRRAFGDRFEKPILDGDGRVLERLRARLRPFLLRRLKREVAKELPPRTESILHCELDEDERALYDAARTAARADVVAKLGEGTNVLAALEALLRLRQAACHRGLLPGREARTSSKVEALCEALEDAVADGHKALVFSQWTSFLDLVEPHLQERNIPWSRLDGSTRDRGAVVDTFQSPDGPPVLLLSLTAGGTGLNLTAADHVFLLDPWWNPAVEEQAADRAHRIGQDRPVFVYRLVAKDTVEERVLDLQTRKRQLAESALSGEVGAGQRVTREEILALLDP